MPDLPCITLEPATTATASIIWLHGLGADGHDFEAIVPELRLPKTLPIRFVFPNAPSIPVTINNGYVMPAWYDILEMNVERKLNEKQLIASADAVHGLIDREIKRGVASQRIILAGFSQGGAVNYHAALTYPHKLGGLLALSTYFPTADSVVRKNADLALDILICHGTQDPVVPELLGQKSVKSLSAMGYRPQYKTYPMPHSVCAEEVVDISIWIQKVLA
ncbi:MAG: carboxylesterase [Gammaproteobacteria bacterium]|nr:carboxylesterase [Gammaproteobacteria bacterium]